ncbi:MAG: PAS domain S-box protein, partial [Steroidobacteraceae bacterium]
ACLISAHQRRALAQAQVDRNRLVEQVTTGQRRLQFALESAGLVAWEANLGTGQLYLSSNAAEVFGIRWTTVSQAIAAANPADVSRARAVYESALKTGGAFTCELRLTRTQDERQTWLEIRGQPLRGASGSVALVAGVAVDITDRRAAERDRAQLAAVVLSSDDAIISMTPDGFVSSWNDGAACLLGYSSKEMYGESIDKVTPPEAREEGALFRERIASGERVDHYESVRLAKDGRVIPVSIRLSPILDRAGRIIGISKIARDITARKRAEEAQRLADQRKDAFLATLAHELRNPLAPIRYATRLLEPGVPLQMASDAKNMIDRQLAHMARLLDDLLDVSRVTRGTLEIRREQLDLREVIQGAVSSTRPLADAAHQELAVSVPAEPLSVSGDDVRLAQMVGNLLHNATKYTPEGGHITVAAWLAGDEVIVSVKDDGIGIAPEALPTLFEPFVQSDRTGARASGGLGIGLSFARDLVRLHGGQIEARSAGHGLGSEFIVHLPRAEEKPALAEPVAAPEKVTALGASGIRVLVVDDNVDAATSLSYVLSLAGYQVTVAHDGIQALEIAQELHPDIVLLDIGLPGMSGHEVARRLRGEPWAKDVQLIAVTGWGQEGDRTKSLEAGFDEHLTKPIDPEVLLRRIARTARDVA